MNICFPRSFAASNKKHNGRTYHLHTKESLEKIEMDPSPYVATGVVATADCLNATNVEADNNPLEKSEM